MRLLFVLIWTQNIYDGEESMKLHFRVMQFVFQICLVKIRRPSPTKLHLPGKDEDRKLNEEK